MNYPDPEPDPSILCRGDHRLDTPEGRKLDRAVIQMAKQAANEALRIMDQIHEMEAPAVRTGTPT